MLIVNPTDPSSCGPHSPLMILKFSNCVDIGVPGLAGLWNYVSWAVVKRFIFELPYYYYYYFHFYTLQVDESKFVTKCHLTTTKDGFVCFSFVLSNKRNSNSMERSKLLPCPKKYLEMRIKIFSSSIFLLIYGRNLMVANNCLRKIVGKEIKRKERQILSQMAWTVTWKTLKSSQNK